MSVWQSATLVGGGAALGAILRWGIGLWLNPLLATLSFGTLIVNWLGCFLIGILTALIWQFPQFPSEWRLFFITGFLFSILRRSNRKLLEPTMDKRLDCYCSAPYRKPCFYMAGNLLQQRIKIKPANIKRLKKAPLFFSHLNAQMPPLRQSVLR